MAERSSAAEPPSKHALLEKAKKLSVAGLLIFLGYEGVGVPLVLAGGEGAANLRWIPAVVGFGFGLPLMAAGVILPFVKDRFDDTARRRVTGTALTLVVALILAAFVYSVGPVIYEHIVPPTSNPATPVAEVPPSRPISPVRLDIMSLQWFPPSGPGQTTLSVNVWYMNRSPSIAARGLISDGKILIVPTPMTEKQEEEMIDLFQSKLNFPADNINAEVPPGKTGYYTITSDVDEDGWNKVLGGKEYLYLFTHIKYGDSISGLMTETQFCVFITQNTARNMVCHTFNRVFSSPSPRPYLP